MGLTNSQASVIVTSGESDDDLKIVGIHHLFFATENGLEACFIPANGQMWPQIHLPLSEWRLMGEPKEITMTYEAGFKPIAAL